MPRAPALFRQGDVTRALKAAKAAGVRVRVVVHSADLMEICMLDEGEATGHPAVEENSGAGWFNEDGSLAIRA